MRSKFFYLCALHFCNDGFSAALLLFLPFIAQDLHLNLAKVGLLGTGLNLLPIAVALPTVFFAQKFGNFKTLLLALLLYGLGYLAVSAAWGFGPLLIIFMAIGIGFGLFHPVGFSSVARWSERSNIGKNLGNFTAWGDVGRIVISGGVTFIIVALSWRKTAFLYGAVALLFFGYLYFFHFRKSYLQEDDQAGLKDQNFRDLLGNHKFIAALFCCALDNLASGPLFLFLPFLLLTKHIQPTFLGPFAGAFLIGNMSGKAVLGGAVDKLGSVNVFVVTELLMAALILVLTWVNGPWLIAGVAIVLGVATRGTVPATRSLVYKAVHLSGNFERANSLVEVGNMSAMAVSPLLLGLVSDRFGVPAAFYACAVFAVLALLPAFAYRFISDREKLALAAK